MVLGWFSGSVRKSYFVHWPAAILYSFLLTNSALSQADPTAAVLQVNYTFAAGTANSNLRFHLENHHEAEYVKVCAEKGWPMQLVKWKAREALTQSTLDDSLREGVSSGRPIYTRSNFIRSLINFIVADDQVLFVC